MENLIISDLSQSSSSGGLSQKENMNESTELATRMEDRLTSQEDTTSGTETKTSSIS